MTSFLDLLARLPAVYTFFAIPLAILSSIPLRSVILNRGKSARVSDAEVSAVTSLLSSGWCVSSIIDPEKEFKNSATQIVNNPEGSETGMEPPIESKQLASGLSN